jgi:hypothetical protein
MRSESETMNHAVASIPPSIGAHTIKEHFNPKLYTGRSGFEAARAWKLIERENRKCGWHDPTVRVRYPWPTELVRVKAHMSIGGPELPLPQPIRLLADGVQEPAKSLQSLRDNFKIVMESDEYKGGNP